MSAIRMLLIHDLGLVLNPLAISAQTLFHYLKEHAESMLKTAANQNVPVMEALLDEQGGEIQIIEEVVLQRLGIIQHRTNY